MKYLKFFQYTLLSVSIFIMGVPPSTAMEENIPNILSRRSVWPRDSLIREVSQERSRNVYFSRAAKLRIYHEKKL